MTQIGDQSFALRTFVQTTFVLLSHASIAVVLYTFVTMVLFQMTLVISTFHLLTCFLITNAYRAFA